MHAASTRTRARTFVARVGILILAVALLTPLLPVASASAYSGSAAEAESQFFTLLNRTRASAGLAPLASNATLSAYARSWSSRMGAANNLVHSPNLARETAIAVPDWRRAGENIGVGGTVSALHNAFYASAPHRANMLGAYNQVGVGVVVVRSEIWVTFRFAYGTVPRPRDTTPPTSRMAAPNTSPQALAAFRAAWSGSDAGTGIAYFDVDVSESGKPWVRWLSRVGAINRSGTSASGSFSFFGRAGHTYTFRVRAVDKAGNASTASASATTSTAVAGTAPRPMPFGAAYAVGIRGELSALSSVPIGGPQFSTSALRGFALRTQGGGYDLDYSGGIWSVGNAPKLANSGYFRGRDVMRGLALNPDGHSGYALDGAGGLWPAGNAVHVYAGAYWRGRDIARDIVLLPTSTATRPAGYVMDAFGGLHAFGAAPPVHGGPYWSGWAIARDVVLNPNGPGGWILDGWGGLNPFGGAPRVTISHWWRGQDLARGAVMFNGPHGLTGYVLDAWGGVHPVNGAPLLNGTRYWPHTNTARYLALTP